MKVYRKLLAGFLGLVVCATVGLAQEDTDTMSEDTQVSDASDIKMGAGTTLLKSNAIIPTGKTLPERVLRVRASHLSTQDNGKLYDKDGNDSDLPLNISGSGAGFVAEYGLNDKISLQLLVPYTLSQKGELKNIDRDALIDKAVTTLAQGFVQQGAACGDLNGCKAYIKSNPAAPSDISAGALGTITKGTSILSAIQGGVDQQIASEKSKYEFDGDTGLGDIEVGVLYNIYNQDSVSWSLGGGFRFATGKFTDPDGKPTGRGTTDLGLRLNLDYAPLDFFLLSWENQTEFMLVKGTKKIGEEEFDFEREGALNKGFIQMAFAAAKIHDSLKSISLYTQYVYKVDAQARVDGEADSARAESYSMLYGFGVSGLDYGIPLSLNVDSYETIRAKNTYGSKNLLINLKAYYKF